MKYIVYDGYWSGGISYDSAHATLAAAVARRAVLRLHYRSEAHYIIIRCDGALIRG